MTTFNNSGAYSILYSQKGVYYVQGAHYFDPKTFSDLGTTLPASYQSLSSERSDVVNIVGGSIDGVTIGSNSTINASISGNVTGSTITGSTITGGSINGTPIGQTTPAAGAFTGFNATSANVLGPLGAEGVSATTNGNAAGTTNTGVMLGSSTLWASETFFDSALTTDNKTADVVWQAGVFSLRFKNDSGASATPWLTATGGYAAGISAISANGTTTVTKSGGNGITFTPTAASGVPSIVTAGVDNNISLSIGTKGSGGITLATNTNVTGTFSASGTITPSTTNGIVGTTLADNANAGSVGEVITNTGTNVSLTTSTPANITSVTLTAGDWDVYGSVVWNGTSSTSTSQVTGGLSTVSATLPAQPYYYRHQYGVGGFVSATLPSGAVPMQRINVSTSTVVYLVASAVFTASTETATAVIIARRVR